MSFGGRKLFESTMKRIIGLLLIVGMAGWNTQTIPENSMLMYSSTFRQIQEDIRDCVITPDSAARAWQENMRNIRATFHNGDTCRMGDSTYFVFPIKGYTPQKSIGGRGMGYRAEGFDLFDMDVRGSHPAQDLFVFDRNQDNIDDRTWKPIDVLAFTSGIVVAAEKDWKYDSDLRGGNWIWIYDPCLDGLFYYAHNNVVFVEPGQWVNAGDKISEMGRSGYNAFKRRSPTHLHLMFLKLNKDALPEPGDTYDWLMNSIVKQ